MSRLDISVHRANMSWYNIRLYCFFLSPSHGSDHDGLCESETTTLLTLLGYAEDSLGWRLVIIREFEEIDNILC